MAKAKLKVKAAKVKKTVGKDKLEVTIKRTKKHKGLKLANAKHLLLGTIALGVLVAILAPNLLGI